MDCNYNTMNPRINWKLILFVLKEKFIALTKPKTWQTSDTETIKQNVCHKFYNFLLLIKIFEYCFMKLIVLNKESKR